MAAIQGKLEDLIKPEWRNSGSFVDVDREMACAIIDAIQQSIEFDSVEFEWNAMRALIDYYSQNGDEKFLFGQKLAENFLVRVRVINQVD